MPGTESMSSDRVQKPKEIRIRWVSLNKVFGIGNLQFGGGS